MNKIIVPNNHIQHVELYSRFLYPTLEIDCILGEILELVGGSPNRDSVNSYLLSLPCLMSGSEAESISGRIKQIVLNRHLQLFRIAQNYPHLFSNNHEFFEFCFDFAIFLSMSGGYTCS